MGRRELPSIRGNTSVSNKFGSSSGGAQEAPNTLRSLTFVGVIDLIGEGPIQGLHNGLQSVYFNNTPYQNPNGSFYFLDTTVEIAFGYPDQAPLPGFTDVETATAVGVQVFYSLPLTIAIDDLTANAVRVTLEVPALYSEDQTTGNVNDYTVGYVVSVQQLDGPWVNYPGSFNGKTISPYYTDVLVPMPGPGPWNIKITKTTPDDTTNLTQGQLAVAAYSTIESRLFSYPDSAVIGVLTEVAIFNNTVPTRTYEIDGLLIQVPSNYNPTTRTYSGLWDGTFKTAFSNNPAWIMYDILTNTRYGLGLYLQPYLPDKWGLYTIAQWCDGTVPDGFGGTEPRFVFNGIVPSNANSKDQALDVLQSIASLFWGAVYWYGGEVCVYCDMPGEPVGPIFTQANVIDGVFTYTGIALKARHQQALITWHDPKQQYQTQVEVVQNLTINAWNAVTKNLNGCTSRGQAHRYGKWILDTEQHATQTVTFSAGWDSVGIVPGNIILVADPAWAGIRTGGRLTGVTAVGSPPTVNTVTMDAPYDFQSVIGYQLSIVQPNGVVETQPITNAPGSSIVVTLANNLSQVPMTGTIYTITGDVSPKPFRVLVVKESAPNVFEITALEHDPTKYERIEDNIQLAVATYTVATNTVPAAPTNVQTSEYVYLLNGATFSTVTVSWTPSSSSLVLYYDVQYFSLAGVWVDCGQTSAVSMDIQDLPPGTYSFRVQAANAVGQASAWQEIDNVSIQGLLAPPTDVTGFAIATTGQQSQLSWNPVTSPNLGWYRIKWTPVTSSTNWSSAQLLADNITGTSFQTGTLGGTFLIKAVSNQGVESSDPTTVTSLVVGGVQNVVQTLQENPTFGGTKTNCTVTGGNLELTYDSSAGTYINSAVYQFLETVDLGAVYTAQMIVLVQAFGQRFSDEIASWATLSSVADMSGVGAALWNTQLQYRITQTDPSMSPTWTDWAPLTVTYATFRGAQFQLVMSTTDNSVTPVVEELSVTIGMDTQSQGGNNVVCGTGGITISFAPPFLTLSSLTVSPMNANPGDTPIISGKTAAGFTIQWQNINGTPITRTFDWNALGFGQVA
jgi:predicted phage tail protein